MVDVNGVLYDVKILTILEELREQLSSKGVHLFKQIRDLPNNVMISCPFHKNGQERRASCGIRKSDGWVHCFSCGESCSLAQMISRCFNYSDCGQFGSRWLQSNFLGEVASNRDFSIDLLRSEDLEKKSYVPEKILKKYRYTHPYMYQRKMTDEVIEIFDIRLR